MMPAVFSHVFSSPERGLTAALMTGAVLLIPVSLLRNLWLGRFEVIVEAPCDPAAQTCFLRDCETGDCPPNKLAAYRVHHLLARDFARCTDATCANLCAVEPALCREDICIPGPEQQCSSPHL